MARFLALEWEAREARVAVASSRGNDMVAEQAFSIALTGSSPDEIPSLRAVTEQLKAALVEKGLTGSDALAALPRSSIELRALSLPQAPPEEIPDMVRFQAMQAFTSIGEDWPVDYVELDAHEDSINVLAAVVSPKVVDQTREVCAASELKPRCLVLRPFAAVSLLHRCETIDIFRNSLIVDLLSESADLTAISHGQVVFMRSVRSPQRAEKGVQSKALVGELRRTIGAAQNQMGGTRIEQVIICGSDSEHAQLRSDVADALSLEVVVFDPFDAVQQTRELRSSPPQHTGRFAPLLGMLACQITGTGHTLDFLNPRKRPEPASTTNRNLLIAAALLLVASLGASFFWSKKSALDQEITSLQAQSTELDEAVDRARELIARVDRLEEFARGDITWLDELRATAQSIPSADDVIVNELFIGVNPAESGGRMTLRGNVASTDVIAELEETLRYRGNEVKGYKGTLDPTRRDYPYQIETTVAVPPDLLDQGHSLGRPPMDAAESDQAAPGDTGKKVTDQTSSPPTTAATAEFSADAATVATEFTESSRDETGDGSAPAAATSAAEQIDEPEMRESSEAARPTGDAQPPVRESSENTLAPRSPSNLEAGAGQSETPAAQQDSVREQERAEEGEQKSQEPEGQREPSEPNAVPHTGEQSGSQLS